MSDVELWRLPLKAGVVRKFQIGREGKGDVWIGRHPLVEAYDELLDALVYLAVADRPTPAALTREATALRQLIEENDGFASFKPSVFDGHLRLEKR